jgi:FdhE protein
MTSQDGMIEGGRDAGTTVPPPPVLLPDTATLFERRAQRLAAWADGHPMADYLDFLAHLAKAQHQVAADFRSPIRPGAAELDQRREHAMPLLPRDSRALDGAWRAVLAQLLALEGAASLPAPARQAIDGLAGETAADLDARAFRFLHGQVPPTELAATLFVAAALQVVWSASAAALDPALFGATLPAGGCPVCGSAPVAAILMAGDPLEGLRYLHCGLCAAHWYYPRAQCTVCESERGIVYRALDRNDRLLNDHVKGETCQECRSYLKIMDEAKSPGAEPFADDLATVGLDLRLAEAGWQRAAANPFLMASPG